MKRNSDKNYQQLTSLLVIILAFSIIQGRNQCQLMVLERPAEVFPSLKILTFNRL
jgi:hypothetical protein